MPDLQCHVYGAPASCQTQEKVNRGDYSRKPTFGAQHLEVVEIPPKIESHVQCHQQMGSMSRGGDLASQCGDLERMDLRKYSSADEKYEVS